MPKYTYIQLHELYIQAARPRYARSYNLHSGLWPSLVFTAYAFQIKCRLQLTDRPGFNPNVNENYSRCAKIERHSHRRNANWVNSACD